ncbi:MAG: SDR family NAD(P)-dependent oxidoreductase, partial [Thermodesulfobacteriota bacterium]
MTQSIFITGASSGIGKAVAYEMGKKGYALALTGRRVDELENVRDDINARYAPPAIAVRAFDVTDYAKAPTIIREMAGEVGGIDIVFANAGIA